MRTDKKLWRNRKAKKGIDVGNSAHYVAVRPDRDPQPVRRFECFTADLHRLADWLESCGVKTVALQSTGCIGSLCTTFWKNAGSRSIWSTPGTPRTCQDARAMCRKASGC